MSDFKLVTHGSRRDYAPISSIFAMCIKISGSCYVPNLVDIGGVIPDIESIHPLSSFISIPILLFLFLRYRLAYEL